MNTSLEIISALLVVSFLGLLVVGLTLFLAELWADEIRSQRLEAEMRERGEIPPRF